MKRPNLKQHLLKYLNSHDGWVRKVDMYVVGDEIEFSPESTGRALRDLAEEGLIEVDYYNGRWSKNLAKYSRKGEKKEKTGPKIVERPDGTRVAVF